MSGLEITRTDWDAEPAVHAAEALGRTALERAGDAHRLMQSSEHFGKIVLRVA